jgi:hypothetical protein
MGRKLGLFAHSIPSLDPRSADLEAEIGKSLRPGSRIFPFCRDYRQRPGSISTAADRESPKFSRVPDFRFMVRLPKKREILNQYYKAGIVNLLDPLIEEENHAPSGISVRSINSRAAPLRAMAERALPDGIASWP